MVFEERMQLEGIIYMQIWAKGKMVHGIPCI
jgi:hypothetical protein